MGLPSLTLRSDSFVIVMRHLGPEGEDWRPEAPALCDVFDNGQGTNHDKATGGAESGEDWPMSQENRHPKWP